MNVDLDPQIVTELVIILSLEGKLVKSVSGFQRPKNIQGQKMLVTQLEHLKYLL